MFKIILIGISDKLKYKQFIHIVDTIIYALIIMLVWGCAMAISSYLEDAKSAVQLLRISIVTEYVMSFTFFIITDIRLYNQGLRTAIPSDMKNYNNGLLYSIYRASNMIPEKFVSLIILFTI